MDDPNTHRIVLRPRFEKQYDEFLSALNKVWQQGGWTCAIDELYYMDAELKLRLPINRLLTQGRDPGKISVVTGMQRPTSVSRFAIGEATHVITFAVEGRDAKILRDATGDALARQAVSLPRHHFAWYYVPTRKLITGKLDLKSGKFHVRSIAA